MRLHPHMRIAFRKITDERHVLEITRCSPRMRGLLGHRRATGRGERLELVWPAHP
jgi:hypothetical protein